MYSRLIWMKELCCVCSSSFFTLLHVISSNVQNTTYKYMHLKDGRMKESKFPLPCLTNDIIIEMVKRKDEKWGKGRRKTNDIDVSLTLIMWYNFPRDIITKYVYIYYIFIHITARSPDSHELPDWNYSSNNNNFLL